jgi:hypothetical protein
MKNRIFGLTFLFFFNFNPLFAQTDLSGTWEGAITIMGQDLKILVHFLADNQALSAKIDIPQQGAKGIALLAIAIAEFLQQALHRTMAHLFLMGFLKRKGNFAGLFAQPKNLGIGRATRFIPFNKTD